ncbi:PepSY domain-containing protein [Streptomyces tremellae]|uniref:PepSY domain-containing protein n=1 Tax=Streptomyces tremellae TaxID=1124239 RepID=A0ABP7EQW7_9ACTN
MKRNLVVAALAAAVVAGGGTYSAMALTGSGGGTAHPAAGAPRAGDRPAGGVPAAAGGPREADDAARAALRTHPGTVVSVEREDGGLWEVELRTAGRGEARELDLDAATGAVRTDERDPGDDGEGLAALADARLTAADAARAARSSVPGTVTSVELDDHRAHTWEATVRSADGRVHDLGIDTRSGAATIRHTAPTADD